MRCHRLLDGKGQSANSFALDGGRIFREMKVCATGVIGSS